MLESNLGKGKANGQLWLGRTATISAVVALFFLIGTALPCLGGILKRNKDVVTYGEGLIINIPLPEPEVAQVVDDVAQNTIIHGTKEYNKDEYVAGAVAEKTSSVFPAWTEGGKVFYKVRKQALDPRNFKSSGDVGTLVVRYVVQPQGDKNTVLRIDALFSEDFRHSVHQSDGTVETSEYKDIQEKLDAIELMKKEDAAALQAKQERLANKKFGLGDATSSSSSGMSSSRADDTVTLSTPPATAMAADNSAMMASAVTQPSGLLTR
jgi:hypothetical protein